MKNTFTTVDFGTGKIVALTARTSGRMRCDIMGMGNCRYAGFADRRWNDPASLNEAISKAIQDAEQDAHIRIHEVTVGVPGEFSNVYTVETKVDIQGAEKRVTANDIDNLLRQAQRELNLDNAAPLHRSPAWFMVGDGKKTLEPVGMHGETLRGRISFVVADPFFVDDISERFRALGITVESFLSTPVGQAMHFVPPEERDRTAVLIDMGYLNTEVMAVEGEAVVFHRTLPVGGGNIAADVAYGLNIPLESAEQIKQSYVFGVSGGAEDFTVADRDGINKTFTRDEVKEVLEPRVEEIAEQIAETIKMSGIRLGVNSVAYLVGGGLVINRGGREFLSTKLGRTVREAQQKMGKLSSPVYTSALGVLDLMIETRNSTHPTGGLKGFFSDLFGG